MQISAANLLIAGQQQAKAPSQPANGAAFQAALQQPAKAQGASDAFESLLFKPATAQASAATSAPAAPAASGPAKPYAAVQPPGSKIDIKC